MNSIVAEHSLVVRDKAEYYLNEMMDSLVRYLPRVAGSIIVLLVGFWIIRWVSVLVVRSLEKRDFDLTLRTFIRSLVSIGLKILLLIMVAGMLGIQTSSFVAVVGAIGLAIGLALQGSLSNFAGGFLIILFKPYRVGDFVSIDGHEGTVTEIQIFNTLLLTPDGRVIILPNGPASNNTIINFTRKGIRRVDIPLAFPIEADFTTIRGLLLNYIKNDPRALPNPAPEFLLDGIGPGDVKTVLRFHATNEHFWAVYHDTQEAIVQLLHKENIRFDDDAERLVIQKSM